MENYLDDTGTHHTNLEDHVQVNREVLQCFRKEGLFVNTRKCEFHKDQMEFLGVEVSPDGFEMEKLKVEMVADWKPPRNVQAVWEFVGFCNFYQQFIKSFSEIMCPLHDLTKVNQQWTSAGQTSAM